MFPEDDDEFPAEVEKASDDIKAATLALFKKHGFDAVRIFATKYEVDKHQTRHYTEGLGNFFSNYGQVRMWLEQQDRADALNDHGEDF